MSKRELINKAIRELRTDLKLKNEYAEKAEWEMYGHMFVKIMTKVDFLFELGILTPVQYSRLHQIVCR